jgi:hypothetical protein
MTSAFETICRQTLAVIRFVMELGLHNFTLSASLLYMHTVETKFLMS